ncbi:unnamed protein product [Blepharisma stoltei]|uniref:U-box domain-containing protein n=1 Tax=Blepharisma stoltei TaxID=1481888 RepID=A0AAU9K1G1_9CILI|nr:unnamed protein product [Blepharisma stoltei]
MSIWNHKPKSKFGRWLDRISNQAREAIDKGKQDFQNAVTNWNDSIKNRQERFRDSCFGVKEALKYNIHWRKNNKRKKNQKDLEDLAKLLVNPQVTEENKTVAPLDEHLAVEGEDDMDALLCPISNELMTDPVMTPYGHCYQKKHIEMWLEKHDTCPLTGQHLAKDQLIPCFTVKSAVDQFLKMQERKKKIEETKSTENEESKDNNF